MRHKATNDFFIRGYIINISDGKDSNYFLYDNRTPLKIGKFNEKPTIWHELLTI